MLHKIKYLLSGNRCYRETEINKLQLEKMVEKGAILVDVRSPQEYEILLPEYEIKEKASKILPNTWQVIIVYCSTGHRSQKAQKTLQKLGYQKVYNLYNGLENYN